jgi:Zn-dependent protease/predicted transcriptional regulator
MGWSFRLARIAGIDIRIHITFFLILVLGGLQWGTPYGLSGALFGILLMILLFVCVTLHELGHGVVAQRFGIPVREIVLLPLGGVALLGRIPDKPLHELLIAVAGPLVNVLLAALLFAATGAGTLVGVLDGSSLAAGALQPSLETALFWLLQANVALVLFNLIPAFPLDGGRMVRALIAMVTDYRRATRIATLIGQALAIVLAVFGILSGNLLLTLVAVFIFVGAGQENTQGQARAVLRTLRVGDAYNKYALTLEVGDRVSKAVDYILTSYQPDFAVLQGGRLLGIVTRDDVLRSLGTTPEDVFVNGIMQREIIRVEADATLDEVRETMAAKGVRVVAVYSGERYLGLVSIEDIAEAFAVISFQERQQRQRQAAGAPPPFPAASAAGGVPGQPGAPTVGRREAETAPVDDPPAPIRSPEAQQIHDQLAAKRRRLGALQIQYSYFGPKTPATMVAEIEQLTVEIDQLEQQLPVVS